ncbi:OB-fold domain-containing protein [Diaphorobacter ruginosibacter]|uniref:OB-fold domain-containing protein n=1 Tax=Diaphorobacter ruginosibacter TaxID=1715720 RepID=A0A7G9RNB6_9BURK|nr:OB-fold domain-containing protein [Diaphorobacter ruginosibacter]QNN57091.1 OB-fold domain-containing protein [Diaphorobacter ruginosibacter]
MNDLDHPARPLAAPFTEGLREGVLRYQRCTDCGHAQTLARYACQRCASESLQWQDACGLATVRAVTVVSRAPSDEFRALAPYTLVMAQLDEGPRLMAHAAAGMQIGQRVRAHCFEHGTRTLVRFEPQ